MQPSTTTYLTNDGIITTTDQSTNRQALGGALSEMGSAVGSEIRRRGYNQPSTYATPAQKGFMLYFLEDVAGNADGSGVGPDNNLLNTGLAGGAVANANPAAGATPLGRGWDQSAAGTMGGANPNSMGNPMQGYGGVPAMGYPGYGNAGFGVTVPYPGAYTTYRPY